MTPRRPPACTLWIISTAGSAESTWLRSWVDQGRASVTDPEANLAYFEWSPCQESRPSGVSSSVCSSWCGHPLHAGACPGTGSGCPCAGRADPAHACALRVAGAMYCTDCRPTIHTHTEGKTP